MKGQNKIINGKEILKLGEACLKLPLSLSVSFPPSLSLPSSLPLYLSLSLSLPPLPPLPLSPAGIAVQSKDTGLSISGRCCVVHSNSWGLFSTGAQNGAMGSSINLHW